MLDVKHTDEPWTWGWDSIDGISHYSVISEETNKDVAVIGLVGGRDEEIHVANARRIVACVNACRGIDQAILENPEYRIKAELDNLDSQIGSRLKAEKERDEFRSRLIALEEIATDLEADIDSGRPLEYSVENLRDELILTRQLLFP